MKRQTKQKLIVAIIGFMFLSSSIAFIIVGNPAPQENQQLDSYVIEGSVNPSVESQYIQAGYTFMKFYYNKTNATTNAFLQSLPDSMASNTGQVQLYVMKIPSADERVEIYNFNQNEIVEPADQLEIQKALCRILLLTPPQCSLISSE